MKGNKFISGTCSSVPRAGEHPGHGNSERQWIPNEYACRPCPQKPTCKAPCEMVRDLNRRAKTDGGGIIDDYWGGETALSIYAHEDQLRVHDTDTGIDKPFLTSKEQAVLLHLWAGMTRQQIATKINISIPYINILMSRIKKKAGQLKSLVET